MTQSSLGLAALTDPEGDTLTYKVMTLPTQGSLFLNTGAAVTLGLILTQAQFLGWYIQRLRRQGTAAWCSMYRTVQTTVRSMSFCT